MTEPVPRNTLATPTHPRSPLHWLGSMVGLRRTLTVDGVQYRPRQSDPRHPRSRQAQCDHEVVFPSGERMRIRPTAQRVYPDLIGQRAPSFLPVLERIIRPGWRIALLASGTGQTAWWLGLLAGPSGSVVALERDGESVHYARRRYARAGSFPTNIAFEIGSIESLAGELDASFDAVIAPGLPDDLTAQPHATERACDPAAQRARAARELGRVLAPGGWLIGPAALVGDAIPKSAPATTRAEPLGDHLVLMQRPLPSDPPPPPASGPPASDD